MWSALCYVMLCLCVSFKVFVCGVCGILCDDVWCVVLVRVIVACCVCVFFHVFVGVVCDLLRGDVWVAFVCAVFVCVSSCHTSLLGCLILQWRIPPNKFVWGETFTQKTTNHTTAHNNAQPHTHTI